MTTPGSERNDDSTTLTMGVLIGLIAAAVLAIVVLLVILLTGDDGDGTDAGDGTTTTAIGTTTGPTAGSTTEPGDTTSTETSEPPVTTTGPKDDPTVTLDPGVTEAAVWPWTSDTVRYDDPVAAARGFAEDYLGFTDPLVGEFQQGDSRSGEVEVRATADGAVTVVLVRQLGPADQWWVLGAATGDLVVTEPEALATITSPVVVAGEARAFEGAIVVQVRADGRAEPLVSQQTLASGGPDLGPYSVELDLDPGTATNGAVVVLTYSERDGSLWEASVLRVAFAD